MHNHVDVAEEIKRDEYREAALVELLLAQPVVSSQDFSGELRQELEGMKLTALQKRAFDEGLSESQVEDAMDSKAEDNAVKEKLISMIKVI